MNPASSRLKPRPDTLLLGLIALSVLVRLWGIADRLPDPTLGVDPIVANTAVDEGDRRAMYYAWDMWRGGARPIDLNPGTGDWPGLPFYLTLGLQLLYRAYDAVTHGNVSAAAFERHAGNDPAGMFLLARIFNVLIGVLTVYLVYFLGRKLGGRALGLWAAALIAFNPAHILASQRVSDPNLLALLFVLLATIQLVDAGAERRTRSSVLAGAMIGLAAACKYVPMVLVLPIVLVQLERGKGRPVRTLGFRWQPAVLGVLAALAAFAIASPFTILDWGAKAQSLSLQRGRLLGEWVGISEAPVSLPTYLTRTFPEMLGWPAYLLAILGSILLFRLPPRGWVVALVPVVLLLPTGALALAQERFMLPAMGSLAVAAAYAAIRLASWLGSARAVPRVAQAPLAGLAAALCVAWTAPGFVHTRAMLHRQDTRVVAHRWIERAIPRTEPLVLDVYGPEFDAKREGRLSLVWPFLATQATYVRAAYHPEWLDGFRYYATAGEVERRFESAAPRYPDEAAFHRWIREHGRVVWVSDSVGASGPRIEIWQLPDGISSREARDALWDQVRQSPMYSPRLARWCSETATIFLKRDRYERAAEWAARGLTIPDAASRRDLLEALSLSQVRLGRSSDAEQAARTGVREYPESALLHLNRAMALEALHRNDEAISEYGAALRLSRNPGAVELIRAQLERLGAGTP